MAKFRNVESQGIITNTIKATSYEGLPKSSSTKAGIIRIDGVSLVVDKDGIVSVKFPTMGDEGDIGQHLNDLTIHITKEDRANLNKLENHLSRNQAHFEFGEKEEWNDTITRASSDIKEHMKKKHLSDGDVDLVTKHLGDSAIHFDTLEQKKEVLEKIVNILSSNQETPNKILVTDNKGIVTLSNISSDVIELLEGLEQPIMYVFDKYSKTDHTHPEYETVDISFHTDDNTVHFKAGEKETTLTDIENAKSDIESLKGLYVDMVDLKSMMPQRKLSIRYIRHTMYMAEELEKQDLTWINMSIFQGGVNIAPTIPAQFISSDMAWDDQKRLKWLDGNTVDVAHNQECSCLDKHYAMVDLGEVKNDISHIRVYNGIGQNYNQYVEVSQDGERWYRIFDSLILGRYTEDKFGKIHIINYEPYADFLHG